MQKEIKNLKKFILEKKFKKILIISGKNSFNNNFFQAEVKNNSLSYLFYFKKSYLPKYDEYEKILKIREKFNPDVVLGIGGGCVIDYAKLVSATYIKEKKIKICRKKKKLIIIPTTAGSGAEATSSAVIYLKNKKISIENKKIIPDYFFFKPSLLNTLNKIAKGSSAFDILAQSIESCLSKKKSIKSINFAKKSIKLFLRNYSKYLKYRRKNTNKTMLKSANYSGKAIELTRTSIPHAVSYGYSFYYKLPHGNAVSLNFIYLIDKIIDKLVNKKKTYILKILFGLFKVKNKENFIKKLKIIIATLQLKQFLNKKFNKKKINQFINTQRFNNCIVKINREKLKLR